jgi:signal transduction histidine kinase/DNA-binding NarL/FixJ family response regulator
VSAINLDRKWKGLLNRLFLLMAALHMALAVLFFFRIPVFQGLFDSILTIVYLSVSIPLLCLYTYYFIKKGIFKDPIEFIFFPGLSFIMVYIIVKRFLLIRNEAYINENSYLFISFAVLLFTGFLSRKSNSEFIELMELKAYLEKRVEESTFQLREANEVISRNERLKTEFLITLAHEIKTPLTLMGHYLERHIRLNGTSKDMDNLRNLFSRFQTDFSNILDSERSLQGIILYKEETSPLSLIAEECAMLYGETANSKGIILTTGIQPDLTAYINGSALRRIIYNLLDNALKFTGSQGSVIFSVREFDESHSVLEVIDTGPGIPEDMMQDIFHPYYQVRNINRENQGIGMGLPIVKALLGQVNGTISVSNRKAGKGAEFKVMLSKGSPRSFSDYRPVSIPNISISPVPSEREQPDAEPGQNNLVLIVEDNDLLREFLTEFLEDKYRIVAVKSGREALDYLENGETPHLIISDIMMDDMDGFDMAENIRRNPLWSFIPLFFLTARNDDINRHRGLELGAVDYLTKPFKSEELLLKIGSLFRNQELLRIKTKETIKTRFLEIVDREEPEPAVIKSGYQLPEHLNNRLGKEEKSLALLICEGHEYKEIADNLGLSLGSVKKKIHVLYRKMGVQNKVELIRKMIFIHNR